MDIKLTNSKNFNLIFYLLDSLISTQKLPFIIVILIFIIEHLQILAYIFDEKVFFLF